MITIEFGHIQNQSGMAVPNGSITFQLNLDATVIAAPYGLVPAAQEVCFQFDANGDLVQPAQIYSNAELQPQNANGLGTYYLVTVYDANGSRLNSAPMFWQFTQAAGSTVDISQMQPYFTGGTIIYYAGPVSTVFPAGSDTDIQYNKNSSFGGDGGLTWAYATKIFTATTFSTGPSSSTASYYQIADSDDDYISNVINSTTPAATTQWNTSSGQANLGATGTGCTFNIGAASGPTFQITVATSGTFALATGSIYFENAVRLGAALYDGSDSEGSNHNILMSTGTATEWIAPPLSLLTFIPGTYTSSQVLVAFAMPGSVFPSGLSGSYASLQTAATGSTTFSLQKNGTQFATVAFSASGSTGTFTAATSTTFSAGDVLTIVGPSSPDATAAGLNVTLTGTRT